MNETPLTRRKLEKMVLQTSNEALGLKLNGNENLKSWEGSKIFLKNRCPVVYMSEII
jgi:hypothetical protein